MENKNKKQKIKLIIILAVEFVAIAAILLMIFFAGKKSYTVTFDLNGGTLLSGDVEQRVTQGQSATPPKVTKDGCYFLKWSASYSRVTRDLTIEAIWEYETTYGIEYTMPEEGKDSNYCTISGCFADLTGDVYIGAYHNEKKVLAIEPGAFANCTGIKNVYLLDGILSIGENAFAGCTSLEKIELPPTLVKLGDNAFAGCTSLQEIVLHEDLTVLGKQAFLGCSSLAKVTFGESLRTIGNFAFGNCISLTEIKLGANVKSIGGTAFAGCSALTSVTLNNVEAIGENAFANCVSLAEVTLGNVKAIGDGAFAGCTALQKIVLPLSVTSIGSGAFDQPTLKVYACVTQAERPQGWATDCFVDETNIVWGYVLPEPVPDVTNGGENNGENEEE